MKIAKLAGVLIVVAIAIYFMGREYNRHKLIKITDPDCPVAGELDDSLDVWRPTGGFRSFASRSLVFPNGVKEELKAWGASISSVLDSKESNEAEKAFGIVKKYPVAGASYVYEFDSVCAVKKYLVKTLSAEDLYSMDEILTERGRESGCFAKVDLTIVHIDNSGHPFVQSLKSRVQQARASDFMDAVNNNRVTKEYSELTDNEAVVNKGECISDDKKDPSGIKSGNWSFFHQNGIKFSEGNYIKGKRSGKFIFWTPRGQKFTTINFVNGVAQGGMVSHCEDLSLDNCKEMNSMVRDFVGDPNL